MGLKPFPKRRGLRQTRGSKNDPRPAFFRCVCFGFLLRTNLFEKSFLQLFSQSTKKRTYPPLFKGQKFPIQELVRNLCCGNESQSKRAVDGQKQTSRPGQAARQDRQAGRWADCQARCTGEDSGPIMGAKSGTAVLYLASRFWKRLKTHG